MPKKPIPCNHGPNENECEICDAYDAGYIAACRDGADSQQRVVRGQPHDYKYRALLEGLTDDPRLLEASRWIDAKCLQEQGMSATEAEKVVNTKAPNQHICENEQ